MLRLTRVASLIAMRLRGIGTTEILQSLNLLAGLFPCFHHEHNLHHTGLFVKPMGNWGIDRNNVNVRFAPFDPLRGLGCIPLYNCIVVDNLSSNRQLNVYLKQPPQRFLCFVFCIPMIAVMNINNRTFERLNNLKLCLCEIFVCSSCHGIIPSMFVLSMRIPRTLAKC